MPDNTPLFTRLYEKLSDKTFLEYFGESLSDKIRSWAVMSVYSERTNDDRLTALSLALRFNIIDAVENETPAPHDDRLLELPLSDEVMIQDRLLSVGMQMQLALEKETRKLRHMKVDDLRFCEVAVRCNFETHLMMQETGLTRRAVQDRKKKLGLGRGLD